MALGELLIDFTGNGVSNQGNKLFEANPGAGDTFMACVINTVLEKGINNLDEKSIKEMLVFANAAASIITTRKGALLQIRVKNTLSNIIC